MEVSSEDLSISTFESSVSELQLSPERNSILKEGFLSAKQNKDLLQARLITNVWSSGSVIAPQEVQELTRSLEQECENGTINVKFDTQLEDETVTDEEEILFRKIQRYTNQNDRLKSGEARVYAIVVPSYWKEEEGLPHTLDSIHEQRFDDTVIVVVSDNNDEQGRQKFDVGSLAKGKGANIATGSIPGNIAFARRKGVDRALVSESLSNIPLILVGTDSDTLLEPGYLSSVRAAYERKEIVATTGPIHFASEDEQVKALEEKINKKHIKDRTEKGLLFMGGANATIRADIYRMLGGYCLDYGVAEDGNLSQKIRDYLKHEGFAKGEKGIFVEGQTVITSARKFLDDEGRLSPKMVRAYSLGIGKKYFTKIVHPDSLKGIFSGGRDTLEEIFLGQARILVDKLKDLKYLFSRQGEKRIRNLIRTLRQWDNFYQRVANHPKTRQAVLNETQGTRNGIGSTFNREFRERSLVPTEDEASVLVGTVLQQEDKEITVFVVRKKSERGDGDRYLAVEVECDPSSDKPPIIASLVEIDEGASERFTKVSWYSERMYFHPDDDYPRTAILIFNTHSASISKVPTEKVDVYIGEKEIRDKAKLLFSAYENSKGEDNKAVEVLRDYVSI